MKQIWMFKDHNSKYQRGLECVQATDYKAIFTAIFLNGRPIFNILYVKFEKMWQNMLQYCCPYNQVKVNIHRLY